jgi:hypothetical protein
MTRVVLHIDRLALNGFARADRHAIVEGLRDELGRRLAEPGVAADLTASPPMRERLQVGGVAVGDAASPSMVGQRLASGIASGIAGSKGGRR